MEMMTLSLIVATVSQDTITSWNDSFKTHHYQSLGTYKVKMNGKFDQLSFRTSSDSFKLIEVKAWGINQWASMNSMFYGAVNLTQSSLVQ
jgi:hypothetical protein